MNREFRVFGPPGTGKTTYISRQIGRALSKYDPEDVVACSFTRAAAVELAGRHTGLPDHNVGTIHSICYHALGCPPLVEVTPKLLDEWNLRHPSWAVGDEQDTLDEPPKRLGPLMAWNVARAQLSERLNAHPFVLAWEDFKSKHQALDFTDLLLRAPESIHARVLFVDEAQDLTPLQWQIVRRWGAQADTFVAAGDDDQLLYSFLGADARTFLEPLLPENKRVLGQSHRLPKAVFQTAERWISKLGQFREPKHYSPRKADGECETTGMRLARPEPLVAEVRDRAAEGQTVMILASCNYMLSPVLAELRSAGVPYHNPYRPKRADWNPLRSIGERILNFLACCRQTDRGHPPPAQVWWPWIKMLKSKQALQRGAKTWIRAKANAAEAVTEDDLVEHVMTQPLVEAMESEDVGWLYARSTKRFRKALEYPAAIYKAEGESGLKRTPRVIVGTIHSVKGGQADVVYLFPDMSYEARKRLDAEPLEARWAMIRQVYVGMTRARRALYLCQPSGKYYWNWN